MEHRRSELLEQDPACLYRWIRQVRTGEEPASQGLNWLGLAEAATTRASVELHRAGYEDLWWAHVALATYQFIRDQAGQHDSIEVSMMHLRTFVLS